MFNALMPGEHDYLKGKPMPGQAAAPVAQPAKKRPIMNALSGYLQFAAPEQYEAGRQARFGRDIGNALANEDYAGASKLKMQSGDFEGGLKIKDYASGMDAEKRKAEAQSTYQLFSSMQPLQINEMAMSDPAGFEQYTGMTSEEYLQTAQRLQQSGMTPEQFHQFVLEKAQAELGMEPTGPQEYMAPIEGVGPDGKPVYYQPSKTGQGRAIEGVMPIKQEADYASAADSTGVRRYTEGPNIGQPVPGFETPRTRSNGITIGPDGTIQIGGPVDGLGYGSAPKGKDAAIAFDRQGNPVVTPGPQQADYNKAIRGLGEFQAQNAIVIEDIDRALATASGWSTGAGAALKDLPVIGGITPAGQMESLLSTIEANVGFDKLQAMREASPTGGALGAVTERELQFLQSVFGSLRQDTTEANVRYNLTRLKEHMQGREQRLQEAIAADFPSLQQTAQRRAGANQQVEDLNELLQFMSPEERALFEDAQ